MATKHFDKEIRLEARRQFVHEEKGPHEIAKHFKQRPSANTIMKWAKEKNPEGKDWYDQRQALEEDEYEKISPSSLVKKILNKIHKFYEKADFSHIDADAIAKLQKQLEKIDDPRYQIPVMYQLMTDFVNYTRQNYPNLITQEFAEAIRDFRTEIRKKLG